jgi:hypothetical protein
MGKLGGGHLDFLLFTYNGRSLVIIIDIDDWCEPQMGWSEVFYIRTISLVKQMLVYMIKPKYNLCTRNVHL